MNKRVYVVCMAGHKAWALDRNYQLLGDVARVPEYIGTNRGNVVQSDWWVPTFGYQRPEWAQDLGVKDVFSLWLEPMPKYVG